MVSVRPFQFSGLPRFTKQQVALQESLAGYLSYRPFQPEFAALLEKLLSDLFKVPCHISSASIKTIRRADLSATLPQTGCIVVVGTAPAEQKILVEVGHATAALAVERLLGGTGEGESGSALRPLTDLETGVLSFPLLRVLSHFAQGWERGTELGLSLDAFASNVEQVGHVVEQAAEFVQLSFGLTLGNHNGYARIFLPETLVTQRFGKPVAQSGISPQDLAYMRQRLDSIGDQDLMARLTISKVDLQPVDIANVEAGDIIVLENHHLKQTPDGLTGDVFVTLGAGKNGGFVARLRNDESEAEQALLEVVKIVSQEQPVEKSMAAEEKPDNLPETEGLLRDIDASVVVELGRIRMNTAQVVRLRAGQVLRLTRGPNDPVDLVVNGKLFARGELIEVEGELGVRLTQVAGAQ